MNDQIADVPVLQTVDQPGDQVCKDPTVSIHRQSCRYACGVAATGPTDLDSVEDCGSPARTVRRQNCGRACDQAVDAVRGPSDSDCAEDGGRPDCAVHRQSCGSACGHADAPVPPAVAYNTIQERISERAQIVDVPEPQTLEELVQAIQLTLAGCAADPVPQFEDQNCNNVLSSASRSTRGQDRPSPGVFMSWVTSVREALTV